jgi:hypothetical protein
MNRRATALPPWVLWLMFAGLIAEITAVLAVILFGWKF